MRHGIATADGVANGITVVSLWDPTAAEGMNEPNDFWIDSWIQIISGDMKNLRRRVTDWVQATGVLTVDPAFINPRVSLLTANSPLGDLVIDVADASAFRVGEALIWDTVTPAGELVTITVVDTVLNQLTIAGPGIVQPLGYLVANNAAISMSRRITDGTHFRLMTPITAALAGHTSVGPAVHLDSDKDIHFTTAIAVNAKEDENLAGLTKNKILIVGVAIQAKVPAQDVPKHYRAIFWRTDGFDDVNLDLDRFIASVDLNLATNGWQIAAANQYYWDEKVGRGNGIEYTDEDGTNELHVSLQNLGVGAKTMGANGEVKLTISYVPVE